MKRTNIYLDEKLISEALKFTGAKSKKEAVDIALRQLVNSFSLYKDLKKLKGKLEWEGDLEQLRKNRS